MEMSIASAWFEQSDDVFEKSGVLADIGSEGRDGMYVQSDQKDQRRSGGEGQ